MRLRRVLLVQGVYFAATGASPFVSRRLFERVTGPKPEWWLVQTVGGLVTTIGGALIGGALRYDEPPAEVVAVAAGSALTLAAVDVVYVARRRIAPTYLIDAAAELAILAGLASGAWQARRSG
jgi:hypothetical protein